MSTEIKELIASWRALTADLRTCIASLQASREEFNDIDASHGASVAQWEAQKQCLVSAIDTSVETVREAENAAHAEEAAASAVLSKANERQARNKQHAAALATRRQMLGDQVAAREAEDATNAERLESFRNRQACLREQLRSALNTLRSALAKERGDGATKLQELRQREEAARELQLVEDKQWALQVARQRQQQRSAFRELMQSEECAAKDNQSECSRLRASMPAPANSAAPEDELAVIRAHVRLHATSA